MPSRWHKETQLSVILIIGYGNSLRQDDGAGFKLADLLALACHQSKLQARQVQVQQLTTELVLDIARPDVQAVIFADTRAMASDTDAFMASLSIGDTLMMSVISLSLENFLTSSTTGNE